MASLQFPDGAFVVVANGHEAKTFHVKDGALAEGGRWTPADLDDDGPAGKTPPETSSQEVDEATFAKQIAERLYKMAYARDFESLVLVADPGTLGQIRPLLHQEVCEKLILEQAKNLVNASTGDIESSLSA